MKIFKIAFAAGLLFAAATLGVSAEGPELSKVGRYWVGEIQKTFKTGPTGFLIVKDIQGDITIKAWPRNEVSVREIRKMDIYTKSEAEAAMQEGETGYSQQGNTVRIGGPEFSRNWIHSSFDITVPAGFECDIETRGGEISVEGTEGTVSASSGGGEIALTNIGGVATAKTGGGKVSIEQVRNQVNVSTGGGPVSIRDAHGKVDVKTGGGEVSVENADGDVSVSTGGGEVDIKNIKGQFKVRTGGGEVHGINLGGSVTASTGGGDLEFTGVQGALDASTGGGDVTAEITLTDFSVNHSVSIRTGGGDIRLTLPEKLPATISAKILTRKRNWEEYTINSDFPLQVRTDDSEPGVRLITADGDINGGGDLIRLNTGGGDIYILKLKK